MQPFSSLLLIQDGLLSYVSYKRKYVHEVLVNRLVKLVQDKSTVWGIGRPNMNKAVDWDFKHQIKQNNQRGS